MKRIRGIDTLRFICAITVLLSHYNVPIPHFLDHNFKQITSIAEVLFNGPAAVIVFFVISGFCIHYPFINNYKINLLAYYTRRLIRIGIPAIIGVVLYKLFNEDITPPYYGVFWSVICEVIYYLIYPLLLLIRKHSNGWLKLIVAAYIVSFALMLTHLPAIKAGYHSYVSLGLLTWIIGLPCWLLGCWLAENYHRFPAISSFKIWLIRLIIFSTAVFLKIVKFHVSALIGSNCFTLNVFAVLVCLWLGFEIVYFQRKEPLRFFELCGKWSYSLYIMHPIVPGIIFMFNIVVAPTFFGQSFFILAALIFSYIYYIIVERPSHRFAVYLSKKLSN